MIDLPAISINPEVGQSREAFGPTLLRPTGPSARSSNSATTGTAAVCDVALMTIDCAEPSCRKQGAIVPQGIVEHPTLPRVVRSARS